MKGAAALKIPERERERERALQITTRGPTSNNMLLPAVLRMMEPDTQACMHAGVCGEVNRELMPLVHFFHLTRLLLANQLSPTHGKQKSAFLFPPPPIPRPGN